MFRQVSEKRSLCYHTLCNIPSCCVKGGVVKLYLVSHGTPQRPEGCRSIPIICWMVSEGRIKIHLLLCYSSTLSLPFTHDEVKGYTANIMAPHLCEEGVKR